MPAGVPTLAVSLISNRLKATHLEKALNSNREIGIAIGILMALHKVSRDEGFDLLRIASQRSHRKLHAVALDVIDTGTLEVAGSW